MNTIRLMLIMLVALLLGLGLATSCLHGDGNNEEGDDPVIDDDDDNSDDDTGGDDDTGDDDDDVQVDVPANSEFEVDTGVDVDAGVVMNITATGTVVLEAEGDEIGPDGVADSTCGDDCPIPTGTLGLLVGRIGLAKGDPFAVGASYSAAPAESGRLFLQVNDSTPVDNSGSFTATITFDSGDDDTSDDDTGDDDTGDDDTGDDDTGD